MLIYLGANIHAVKLISATIFIIRPILQNLYVKKKYNINLKDVDKNYKIQQKWDGLAQHVAAVIHNNTPVVLLTIFSTTKEISVYSVYLLVINGIRNLVQSVTKGVDATFGDMIAKKEEKTLNNTFRIYETIYFTMISIVFTCTMLLILPFVDVYTKQVTDTNYFRPVFAYLLVISEFFWAIRQPYNDLVKVAGHFKETMIGAWIECGINIVLSIILVFKFGIVGVTIGTLVAMVVRTIEFMYHANKYILQRKQIISLTRVAVIAIQVLLIVGISRLLPMFKITSYFYWIIYGVIVFFITTIIIVPINFIFYKNDIKKMWIIIKNAFFRRGEKINESK